MIELINIALVIVFFLAWNENDFITHQSEFCFFPSWKWYTENRHATKSWWLKNVTTPFLDGMHFTSSTYRVIGYFFFAQLMEDTWYMILITTITLYIITGATHSLLNKTLVKRR